MSASELPGEPQKRLPREVGTTGLKKSAGLVLEEFLPQLAGSRGQQVFKEMSENDPVLSGLMYTFEMLFRQAAESMEVRPRIEPGKDSPENDAKLAAEFVQGAMEDMSHSPDDFMAQIASMFIFGWSFFEIVYKKREGEQRSPGKTSDYEDGKIGWRKFAFRAQETLFEWEWDKRGGLKAFQQLDFYQDPLEISSAQPVRIPIEKGLLFRTTTRNTSPEGRSLLRGAYRPWYFKKRIEEIEAIGIERDLAGLPIIHAPSELFSANATAEAKALYTLLKNAVRNIRRDQQDGMVFPREYNSEGNLVYEFELASTGGSRQIDTNEIVKRKNMEMAMSVLADFMMLGHESVGSFALSQDKTNLFAMAVDGFLLSVAQVLTRHAISRLMRLNGIPSRFWPRITFDAVRAPTLNELGEFIQRLARAGAPFFPDRDLQAWFHERAGMPPPGDEAQERAEEHADLQLEAAETEVEIAGQVGNDGGRMTEGSEQNGSPTPAADRGARPGSTSSKNSNVPGSNNGKTR